MFAGVGVIGALASILASLLVSPDASEMHPCRCGRFSKHPRAPAAVETELAETRTALRQTRDELSQTRTEIAELRTLLVYGSPGSSQ